MIRRLWRGSRTATVAASMLLPFAMNAQAPAAKPAVKSSAASSSGWTKRTADGQPDLQGVWTNATITPFERPVALGNKASLTEQEAAELEKRAQENEVDAPPRPGEIGSYSRIWFDSGSKVVPTRQSSLVVDPPDGRVPIRPEAAAERAAAIAREADHWENLTSWDRCITRGVPGGMFPAGYNNAYQIIQTPGYVTIMSEMIHEARIIPIDGRPHLPSRVKQWTGDSRGHWEGNTLVVETTNYNGKGSIATSGASGRIRGVRQSEALRLVERFTRVDADTIRYEVTIDDPKTYTGTWKVAVPLTRDDNYVIYEYACHESNLAMTNILSAGRAKDKAGR